MPETTTILFIINPKSGGKQQDYQHVIKNFFFSLPYTVEFLLLGGKNDAHQFDRLLARLKPQMVVAVGGDGTVSMVAKKLLGTSTHLGILPTGSANGMARELNIPLDFTEALKLL